MQLQPEPNPKRVQKISPSDYVSPRWAVRFSPVIHDAGRATRKLWGDLPVPHTLEAAL